MASNISGKISDNELTDLYNNLEKGSLVKLLIEKHRQLEKQVENLSLCVVGCCETLKVKETISFEEWILLNYHKTGDNLTYKVDRCYWTKEDLLNKYNDL
jgi:hypothetical protein